MPVFGVLLAVLLAFVQLGIVAWYFLYWDIFPKYSAQKIVSWLLSVLGVSAVPLLQIKIYQAVTSEQKVGDALLVMIFFECMSSVILLLYLLVKRRNQERRSE